MVTNDTQLPWYAYEAHLYAAWAAREEAPETISARIDAMLDGLAPLVGDAEWTTTVGRTWAGTNGQKADIVRSGVMTDDDGVPAPETGYSLIISAGDDVRLSAHVMEGSRFSGRRVIRNMLLVDIRTSPGAFTGPSADVLLGAVVDAWDPTVAVMRNDEVAAAARRGGWLIPVGYRLWLSTAVGGLTAIADGIDVERTSAGIVLRAPDDWTAEKVVESMVSTLHANSLDKVPKPA